MPVKFFKVKEKFSFSFNYLDENGIALTYAVVSDISAIYCFRRANPHRHTAGAGGDELSSQWKEKPSIRPGNTRAKLSLAWGGSLLKARLSRSNFVTHAIELRPGAAFGPRRWS
jgi:hypothetical protein